MLCLKATKNNKTKFTKKTHKCTYANKTFHHSVSSSPLTPLFELKEELQCCCGS